MSASDPLLPKHTFQNYTALLECTL
uniref:Uncharacterized protein n=1 Tax=Anguilla anguilla TaxID=7936 RepID=A0A0E9PE25_ANGAN